MTTNIEKEEYSSIKQGNGSVSASYLAIKSGAISQQTGSYINFGLDYVGSAAGVIIRSSSFKKN